MKRFLLLLVFTSFYSFGQQIDKPKEDKALVYFTRFDAAGFLINFKYFDGEKYLGKFNYGKYLVYECEPGKHIFWSKAENFDFVDANLEAGKVYIIDARPKMGAFKAGVELVVFNKELDNYDRYKKRIFKSIEKGERYIANDEELKSEEVEIKDLIQKGMEKYTKLKNENSDKIAVLIDGMFFDDSYFVEKDFTKKIN
ncbi:hypothetical protein [Flavobacterium sangjuense]|uniref:DUF2846 domain-containing protein n=1 Tax=Flavobacterium sangjuense TaxID=2518177 RepID=A0A4P7PR41_9FLAO|nr:hypothetical protein [Flavobacterium sangjuense]QBZ97357.1 hypothetical protein GS03_00845 [Flavobacterium sangjuense]